MSSLEGNWKIQREAGILPPFGLGKRIRDAAGWTSVAHVPVAFFRVEGTTLVYRGWPIRDELAARPDGTWDGRGKLFGREFCRFRLVPADRT